MGRQRNNPQSKGKEESSERMLNEIEASQLSDTEFKAMVIRKFTELTENCQKIELCGSPTTKELKKKHSFRLCHNAVMWVAPPKEIPKAPLLTA